MELLDDVDLEVDGDRTLIQVKHTEGEVDTGSPELWKTIRVWCEAINSRRLTLSTTTFVLLTVSKVKPDSAPNFLRNSDRNIAKAIALLEEFAGRSVNQSLTAAFSEFGKLNAREKLEFMSLVYIVDEQADVAKVRDQVEHELRWATAANRLASLTDKLEGWWRRKLVEQLSSDPRSPMSLSMLELEIQNLRHQYDELNLPIDFLYSEPSENEAAELRERTFVYQLRLIGANNRIIDAIRDYYKANLQRGKWIRETLLYEDDITRYEKQLADEWGRKFREMLDELGEDTAEAQLLSLGNSLYKWATNDADFTIAPNVTEPYVMRGCFHRLSDKQEVGWHPQYKERLRGILSGVPA